MPGRSGSTAGMLVVSRDRVCAVSRDTADGYGDASWQWV